MRKTRLLSELLVNYVILIPKAWYVKQTPRDVGNNVLKLNRKMGSQNDK